ncbi:NOT2 / NOT3 / NOT5 family [Rhizoctonia solani]|uniref:NOT2 / NOT3 / NOT5 family n=1 Tax=Rhizoctonia solani TaxID=456999 RepID=A0A8H7LL70_9AGAM|nr:NOT2 / NOT3 / NOT5 family [Rhizoctonia solani]
MNRPGQAPRVPPNLNPTAQQQLASQFRGGVYPPYGMPQTQQQPQRAPTQPAYAQPARATYGIPSRSFPFSGVQQQAATAAQQSHLHALMPQPNGANQTPGANGANTPDTSTSLDPNEFPALGTSAPQPPFSYAQAGASAGSGYHPPGPANFQAPNYASAGANPASFSAGANNYAQAGAQANFASAGTPGAGFGTGAAGANGQQQAQQRELTQDDFPALGQGDATFANSVKDQHRQNLLGQMGVMRNNIPGYQSELDKRQQQQAFGNIKLNPPNHATAAAWASQPPSQPPQSQPPTQAPPQPPQQQLPPPPQPQPQTQPPPQPSQTTNTAPAPSSTPSSFSLNGQQQSQSQSQTQTQTQTQSASPAPTTASANTGTGGGAQSTTGAPLSQAGAIGSSIPLTPAQQVLMSAADRWGLLGLLQIIKGGDPDVTLLNVGADLSGMGLDMGGIYVHRHLYPSFITPWSDASAALTVEPDYHLPACYNVQPPPPAQAKANAFSDETLFFMFYSSPRDVLQEMASQELYNRNWRFHKERRVWLTKESGTSPSQKTSTHESGVYTFFDPENWERVKMHARIQYDQLEEKHTVPVGGATRYAQ